MEKLKASQQELIKKMATARLVVKLSEIGISDEELVLCVDKHTAKDTARSYDHRFLTVIIITIIITYLLRA